MGEISVKEYLLTYVWAGLECYAATLLFDGFSERKLKQSRYWIVAAGFVFLDATVLICLEPAMASFGRMLFAFVSYFIFHFILYESGHIFRLYITAIYYATVCCIDNLCFTALNSIENVPNTVPIRDDKGVTLVIHFLFIAVCYLQRRLRQISTEGVTNWKWYTVPALFSFLNVFLIYFYGNCFQSGEIMIQPLFVCAGFITLIQVAALFLVSWMEQDAHFREKALSLQTKAQAQQESIEALSAAYAQQRKLTHDFRAHLDTLASLLARNHEDISAARKYVHDLQTEQTNRILLVNTHHSALDALLNQKALVARNRNIDIQFVVNDLSGIRINMVDLTILMSNTLDNAIEASEKLPVQERQIHVQVLLEDDILFYAVRNRSLPLGISRYHLPTTTKGNPSIHGYGLQNVQTTLKKYDSLYAINYIDGWFGFATDLPNTPIS